MKRKILSVALFLELFCLSAFAQTSVLQDNDGQSTLAFGGKGNYLISVNASDASTTLAINRSLAYAGINTFWGANIKIKATNGLAVLIDGIHVKPSFDLGGYFGKAKMSHRLFIRANISNAYFNLVKPGISTAYTARSFLGAGLGIGYNTFTSTPMFSRKDAPSSAILLGITSSFSRINNLDDLDPSTISSSIITTTKNSTQTLLKDKIAAFYGNYHTSLALKLNIDAFIFPEFMSSRIGLGGYFRGQLTGYQPRNSMGIGALLGKKGAPANITFGILYQFNDVFNQLNQESNFIKRGGLNLIAGYKF